MRKMEEDENLQAAFTTTVPIMKIPKILHFSDGTLEDFSEAEDNDSTTAVEDRPQEIHQDWLPWFNYKIRIFGAGVLNTVDTVGGFFTDLFGITTPKYSFEIEEYKRRLEAEEKRKKESIGWSQIDNNNSCQQSENIAINVQPTATVKVQYS